MPHRCALIDDDNGLLAGYCQLTTTMTSPPSAGCSYKNRVSSGYRAVPLVVLHLPTPPAGRGIQQKNERIKKKTSSKILSISFLNPFNCLCKYRSPSCRRCATYNHVFLLTHCYHDDAVPRQMLSSSRRPPITTSSGKKSRPPIPTSSGDILR